MTARMTRTLIASATLFLSLPHVDATLRNPQLEISITRHAQCSRKSRDGDRISVHYNGTLEDGRLFDSSHNRNAPIAFTLGAGQVITGWDQGLTNMCVGEERLLTIPSYLAYGDRTVGMIPAGSTLIFETLLVEIAGIKADTTYPEVEEDYTVEPGKGDTHGSPEDGETGDYSQPTPGTDTGEAGKMIDSAGVQTEASRTSIAAGSQTTATVTGSAETQQPVLPPPDEPDAPDGRKPEPDNGECRLLGPFALVVQAGLGLLAISSLVWKRHRERPRRPFKVWFFDASKQVFGSALLHVLNLFMSILATADIQLAQQTQMFASHYTSEANKQVNPCSWYLINIAIDTTIGIPILVIFLRLLYHAFALTPLARPLESIKSGHYGHPPRVRWWLKQSLIYTVGLVLMKLCVFFIIQILPWIALVGDWALRWTEGSEALQVAFVMFVFPLIMNGLQYYIIDSFIKDPSSGHEAVPADDASTGTQASYHSIEARDSIESDSIEEQIEDTVKEAEEQPLSSSHRE